MKKLYFIFSVIVIFLSCKLSQSEIDKLSLDCSRRDSITSLVFDVDGFKYKEIAAIFVKEVRGGQTIDSFYIGIQPLPYDSLRMRYTGSISRVLHLKSDYHFFIGDQKPYILSDMQMVLRSHFSMTREYYYCAMYHYQLNGKSFENGNPSFVKEGFDVLKQIDKTSHE
jgi:hypothetical protein